MVVDSRSVAQWWLARSLLLLVLSVEWLVVQRCLDAAAGTDPLLFKAKCADRCLSTCVCVVVVLLLSRVDIVCCCVVIFARVCVGSERVGSGKCVFVVEPKISVVLGGVCRVCLCVCLLM